jgi:DNA-binding NarL/FixJ family response regulator
MAEGRSNHAIAERLFVTDHTVEKARQEHLRLAAPAPVA